MRLHGKVGVLQHPHPSGRKIHTARRQPTCVGHHRVKQSSALRTDAATHGLRWVAPLLVEQ